MFVVDVVAVVVNEVAHVVRDGPANVACVVPEKVKIRPIVSKTVANHSSTNTCTANYFETKFKIG